MTVEKVRETFFSEPVEWYERGGHLYLWVPDETSGVDGYHPEEWIGGWAWFGCSSPKAKSRLGKMKNRYSRLVDDIWRLE